MRPAGTRPTPRFRFTTIALIPALILFGSLLYSSSSAANQSPGADARIGPHLRFLQTLRESGSGRSVPAADAAASAPRVQVSIRFVDPPSPDILAELETHGVEFVRYQGEILHTPTVYPAHAEWNALARLADRTDIVRVESLWRPKPLPPLDVSRPQVQADQVWEILDQQGGPIVGEGITIADFDTGVDVYHPMFWYADGDTLSWLDVNGNSVFDPGTDAVDLNDNDLFDPGELLDYFEAPVFGSLPHDTSLFNPDIDWLYNDADGDGNRDYGPGSGFTESDPTYGELVFWAQDINENDSLDPGEELVALGTCKVRAIYETTGTVRRRGVDLIDSESDYWGHGTSVAGILAGGAPGVSRMAGIAPGAELLMGNNVYISDPPFIITLEILIPWAAIEGADVMLYEDGEWVWHYLDGSSNVETMIDEMAEQGIIQVVPAGNLTGGRMHVVDTLSASGCDSIGLIAPVHPALDDIWPSIIWRGTADTSIVITLESPAGDTITLDGNGDYDSLGDYSIYSYLSESPRGTTKMDVHITNASPGGPVNGTWWFHLVNLEASAIPVHGFHSDNLSSWYGFTFWLDHENGDVSTVTWPATADSSITVAAYQPRGVDQDINDFSGRGPRIDGAPVVDITAPGSTVYAPVGKEIAGVQGGYAAFGGTSSAGPHVAGAAALLLQQTPGASNSEVRQKLTDGALSDEFTGAVPNPTWGWGKLRIFDSAAPQAQVTGSHDQERGAEYRTPLSLALTPNPAGGDLAVSYDLPVPGPLRVEVYDVRGRLISRLYAGPAGAGRETRYWNGCLSSGYPASPGTYFVRVIQGDLQDTGKIILCR